MMRNFAAGMTMLSSMLAVVMVFVALRRIEDVRHLFNSRVDELLVQVGIVKKREGADEEIARQRSNK